MTLLIRLRRVEYCGDEDDFSHVFRDKYFR
jgi:hypothetical protein